MASARMTTEEKIRFTYDGDVAKFSQAEEAKKLKLAASEAERLAIILLFALNRKALLDKEQTDLLVLRNSQGWRGVFGSEFAALLKGNEAALREWAGSVDQAAAMVKLSL